MPNLPEQPAWESGIHQLEESDRAKAGPGGVLNIAPGQLANRTLYLKAQLEAYDGLIKSGELPFTDEPAAAEAISQGKVPEGALFSIRSQNIRFWADEFKNVNGSIVATGKHLPDASAITPLITPTIEDPDGTLTGLSLTQAGQNFVVLIEGDEYPLTYYSNNMGVAVKNEEVPGIITIQKLQKLIRDNNILIPGKNLFNKLLIVSGYYLFEGSGIPTPNPNYCYSEFIPVTPGSVYSSTPPELPTSPARVTTFYDENFAYVSDVSSVDTFTVPDGVAFVRVSVLLSDLDDYQLSKGVGYSPYEEYQGIIKTDVNLFPAMGFTTGKNLFNPNTVINGVHISSIGTIFSDSNTTHSVSDYIPVNPEEPVACDHQWRTAAWYDVAGAFISRQYDTAYMGKAIRALETPANAAFLRIEVPTSVVPVVMIEKNNKATDFEDYCSKAPDSFSGTPIIYSPETASLTEDSLYTHGTNLFNKARVVNGYINEFGSWFPVPADTGSVYITSNYIKVAPGDVIRSNLSMRFVACYDADKKFVQSMTATTNITIPETVSYIRVTTLASNIDAMFIAKSAVLPPVEGFVHVMRKTRPDGFPVRIPGDIVNADELDINFVSHGLMTRGKNLFNRETVQSGYINESGTVISPDSRYVYSDYISLEYNTAYALLVGARFIAYYDANKAFIRADASSVQALTSFVTDSTIAYARITLGSDRYNDAQVEKGATATAFEEYAYYYLSEMPDGTPVKMKESGTVTTEPTPDFYALERLRETHMRLTKMTFAEAVRLVVAMLGDSYTRTSARYVLKVAQMLWRYFNNAGTAATIPPVGYGWRSFGYDGNGDNTDVFGTSVTQSGFTCAYNTGHGPDISSVTAAASGATISYSQNFALGFDSFLFAEGGSGVIQYQATGGEPVTIDLSSYPAGMQILPLALPTAGSGTVTYTVITPPVTLYGVNILNQTASGVLVHKMGGSGSHSNHWVNAMDQRWLDAFENLGADLVTIMLGTNDQGAQLSASTFRTNILTLIDRVRSVRPTADILLICPAENNRPTGNSIPMTTYAEVMYKIARDDRDVAFLNLQASFGLNHEDYAAGSARPWMIGDGLHPDPNTGGYAIAGAIARALGVSVT
ncbi:SGNH/GDSL hydrolase family protein [Klebsiella pneumoniae]|nr:SGNH/GDSL hydrolase family protein [Klebsiella pneumoniae]